MALDPTGAAYVTGVTASSDFPVLAASQPLPGGGQDAFVTKLSPSGAAILYSTFLGGDFTDVGNGIAVDSAGNAFIIGLTSSSNFPTASPFQSSPKGLSDAFVTRLGSAVSSTTVHFSQLQYSVDESTPAIQIDVRRSGDLSGTSTVDFETVNGTASDRSDFTPTFGSLTFAPGDAVESFTVLLTDDALVEGTESLRLKLSNPVGAILVSSNSDPLPHDVLLEIRDNDSNPSAPNPIENSEFFVRQHYHDFLNREPDAAGLHSGSIKSKAAAATRAVGR